MHISILILQTVVLAGACDGESVVKKIAEEYGQDRACFMHMDVNSPRDFDGIVILSTVL